MGFGSVFAQDRCATAAARRSSSGGWAGCSCSRRRRAIAAEFDDAREAPVLVDLDDRRCRRSSAGCSGEPINIETLGGYLSWRVGNVLPVMLGLWSVLALSGTLAGEARRGSLDLLVVDARCRAARSRSRRSPAMSTALVVAMLLVSPCCCRRRPALATLPGDEIPLDAGARLGAAGSGC